MSREQGRKLVAQNKKARHDYLIIDTYECGLVLTGILYAVPSGIPPEPIE